MRVFLDTSVLLAACGSSKGASREVFRIAGAKGWALLTSPYVLAEVDTNLDTVDEAGRDVWADLVNQLQRWPDILTIEYPVVFGPAKDRPVLFSALAWADVLLTLDRRDFGGLIATGFYGLDVMTPAMFLRGFR